MAAAFGKRFEPRNVSNVGDIRLKCLSWSERRLLALGAWNLPFRTRPRCGHSSKVRFIGFRAYKYEQTMRW